MEFATMSVSKIHILRVDPGEDLLASTERFLREAGIRQAVVLGGYGTLAAYHLHWVTHNRIPTENVFRRDEGGIEILAMNGLVVNGEPHIHVALSNEDGAFGGHLEPGCIALPEPTIPVPPEITRDPRSPAGPNTRSTSSFGSTGSLPF